MENEKIQTIILCGGKGTRMKEETEFKPKPMVLIGGKPILWHIMKIYSSYGYNNFILALGYKGEMIKEYFYHSKILLHDFKLSIKEEKIDFFDGTDDDFEIIFADTGSESLTGERLLRVEKYIEEDDFMITYGDGVSDVDINKLVAFHKRQQTLGTITGVHPYSRYGLISLNKEKNLVKNFDQKPLIYDYISGGFMVFKREAFKYFDNGPMENGLAKLAEMGQLSVYKHEGFWKAMDTYREVEELNLLWDKSRPWAVWEK